MKNSNFGNVVTGTTPSDGGQFSYNYLTEEVSITLSKEYKGDECWESDAKYILLRVEYWKSREGLAQHFNSLDPKGMAEFFFARFID